MRLGPLLHSGKRLIKHFVKKNVEIAQKLNIFGTFSICGLDPTRSKRKANLVQKFLTVNFEIP
jgi:hypothetical protein